MAHHTVRTPTRRLAAAGLALAAAAALASCGSPTDNDTRSATAGLPDTLQSLQAETWVLDPSETTPAVDTEATITLSFGDERLQGQAPCNVYGAPFELEGDHGIDIGPVTSTMAACDDLDAERAYLGALEEVDEADTVDPTRLVLEGDGVSLAFDRLDLEEAIAGTWTITALRTGDAVNSPVEGTEPTLTFGTDGTLSADAGCNPIATTWKLDDAAITFGTAAQGLKACPEPEGVDQQEAALAAALGQAARVDITDELTVLDEDGHTLITATKQAE